MFKNYVVTAIRNIWANKSFSLINILGLSIGLSASLVIFLIVYYEFSFDRFEKDRDRIYRVTLDATFNGSEGHSAGVPAPLGAAMENEVTGLEKVVPVFQFQGDANAKVRVESATGKHTVYKKQGEIVFTNEQYFDMLNHRWITGSVNTSLKDAFKVVLTESRAKLYFPGMAPGEIIGKQITYNKITTTVSGIVKDLNEHTSFTALEFISLPTISKTSLHEQFMMNVWNDWMLYSQLFVKLAPGSAEPQVEKQLKALLNKYNKDANRDANNRMAFNLQPLDDIHFNPAYQSLNQRTASRQTLGGLLAIAGFLLLLGCINFINLTTANASRRAKEIGIRKTMGSSKAELVSQFLGETFVITLLATIVSIAIAPILLKAFSDFIPEGLSVHLLGQPHMLIFLLALVSVVSFLAGLYPALILSGYKPVLVLKNQAFTGSAQTRHAWIRKTLTVSQFVIAQVFVIATVMVSRQISYSIHADMGFSKAAIINFNMPRDTVSGHRELLLNAINSLPGVELAATGFFAPADEGVAFTNLAFNTGKEEITPNTQIRWGDPNFIKIYKIALVAGRNVLESDSIKEFLVNETYARAIGFSNPADAINQQLKWNKKSLPIVGIMKDFHDQSFRATISPVVFGGNHGSTFHIKLKKNNAGGSLWRNTIAGISKIYRQVYPEEEFNYHFVDETIANLYRKDQQTAGLLKWATGLAIFISCLGLLGLVIYTTNTRTKEIGIRKVLGASVASIVSVLSIHFIQLICVAFLIAAPFAWWATYQWLQDFAYRTTMNWWIFVLCGFSMICIAALVLSFQIIKTAVANPVKSLRTE